MAELLTERSVRALQPKATAYKKTEPGSRGEGRMLVKVHPSGLKELYYRYRKDDADRTIKLGRFQQTPGDGGITLKEARAKVADLVELHQTHGDVKAHLERERLRKEEETERERRRLEIEARIGSFGQLMDGYVESLRAAGKVSAREVDGIFDRHVRSAFPKLLMVKADEITPGDVQAILARLVQRGTKRVVNKTRSYLGAAFSWASKADHDPRRLVETGAVFRLRGNPVSLVPRIAEFENARDRTLNETELRLFWEALRESPAAVQAFLRFNLAMGGQRIIQLLRVTWNDFDQEKQLMLIRDGKGRGSIRDHLLPLTKLGLEQLEPVQIWQGQSDFIFTTDGQRSLHASTVSHAVNDISKRLMEQHGLTPFEARDIRRTTETLLASLGIDRETRAQLLSHGRTSGVQARHYDRYHYLDEKKSALLKWEQWLRKIIYSQES